MIPRLMSADLELVWFQSGAGVGLGAVTGGGEKNTTVVDEQGEVQKLKRARVLLPLKARLEGMASAQAPAVRDRLRRVREELARGAVPIDAARLDAALKDEGRYDLADLARLVTGEVTDASVARLLAGLGEPEGWLLLGLRLDQGQVVRLDAAARQKIREQREREAARRRDEAAALAWWAPRRGAPGALVTPPEDPAVRAALEGLSAWALAGEHAPGAQAAQRLARALDLADPDDALVALEQGGALPRHVNECAARAGLPRAFPADVRAEAEAIAARLAAFEGSEAGPGAAVAGDGLAVLDLRARHTIAIDDPETTEVDDALSAWTGDDGGVQVAIHIARVAGLVPVDGPLDREVQRRATTVYFSDESIPMLPVALGERLSLERDADRLAVSLLLRLGPDGLPREPRFAATRVTVHERLGYDATPSGASARVVELLHPLARALREARGREGAVILSLPQLRVRARDGVVTARVVPVDGPLNLCVSELMVLYNAELGRALAAGRASALFRTQPRAVRPPAGDPKDPLFGPHARRLFPPTIVSLDPGPHRMLGVPAYVQGTSPLRRAGDLLAQRQLLAVLAGGPPALDRAACERLKTQVESSEKRAQRAMDDRERYWLGVWWSGRGGPEDAIVSRLEGRTAFVYVLALDRELPVDARDGPPLAVGQRARVIVVRCDPRRRDLRLGLVLDA